MHSMFCRCSQCWRCCSANKAVGDCPCCPGLCSGDFLVAMSRHRCEIVGLFRVGSFSLNVGWLLRRTSMTPDCSYKTASLQSPNVSLSTALFRPYAGLRTDCSPLMVEDRHGTESVVKLLRSLLICTTTFHASALDPRQGTCPYSWDNPRGR